MHCRLLHKDDFESLHKTFVAAFSDYEVKFQPTTEEFSHRIHQKLHCQLEISGGAFDGEEMVGFMLHTSNIYQGIPSAYNGGTGVLPGFRNQKAAERMYDFLIPKIREKFVARILLEVVDTNQQAIALYKKIGFVSKRRFKCYKMVNSLSSFAEVVIENAKMQEVNFDFNDFLPSFIDSPEQLKQGNEQVLVAMREGKVIGQIIFQASTGRISQIAVGRISRGRGIGRALLFHAQAHSKKPLTIMNIPEDESGFDTFLTKCGFQNQVNQYEMELII